MGFRCEEGEANRTVVPTRDSGRGLELLSCQALSGSLAIPGAVLWHSWHAWHALHFSKPDCLRHAHPETPQEGAWATVVPGMGGWTETRSMK